MAPKEKANELIEKFLDFTDVEFEYEYAIKCALIVVNEILSIQLGDDSTIRNQTWYWEEVKKEIQNLK